MYLKVYLLYILRMVAIVLFCDFVNSSSQPIAIDKEETLLFLIRF